MGVRHTAGMRPLLTATGVAGLLLGTAAAVALLGLALGWLLARVGWRLTRG